MSRIRPQVVEKPKPGGLNPPEGHRAITDDEGYHYCREYIPDIAGTYSGTLLICGGGKDFWEEYKQFGEFGVDHDILAVNIAGMVLPKVTHLFSLHFKQIAAINTFRQSEYAGDKTLVHGCKDWPGIEYIWYLAMKHSTSGFLAVVLGYLLGYRKMVLCGVPMDGSGYFYKPMINETFGDSQRLKEIHSLKESYGEYTRSMTGRSGEILGNPTLEWLKGE